MKKLLLYIPLFVLLCSLTNPPIDFYQAQLRFPRVREALKSKGKVVDEMLASKGVNTSNFDLFFRVFKKEQKFEVWAKNKQEGKFQLIKVYDFCSSTGVLGPKRRSGDRQTPEGFYTIDAFNPTSNYYLSFRVGYPNASDKKLADWLNPGDNIFVHGSCITIGCIPVGDENIKELYLLAARAKSGEQEIPIHIFPNKMTDENYSALKSEYASNATLLEFWSWLKPGYDAFENGNIVPTVTVDDAGKYIVK
ncbi:L,D-transpeptidase family protein [Arcicella sp. LKC2W]|uniref:L,D-transpeptidase family protein n=1 Tax=Arcicella sp. LKC2W TaxID=2984198 RepID=UPI002B20E3EC|nr:L,D-transpeptidase family protein [Arcicella sp. LKC2W]MEA5459767.1 L,D-transpeptidase family protein [Arcicella sp. LKC2W]